MAGVGFGKVGQRLFSGIVHGNVADSAAFRVFYRNRAVWKIDLLPLKVE